MSGEKHALDEKIWKERGWREVDSGTERDSLKPQTRLSFCLTPLYL